MKFKLPLLLALSLMWQAALWADEWTNIATAVTVTEGYLCAGELAADSTGTDILCDTNQPYVDSDGNIGIGTASPANSLTVVGDISATTLNATQLCDENGANCTTLSGGLSAVDTLDDLSDVAITSPVSGSILTYNGSSNEWVNVAATSNTALVAFMVYKTSNQTMSSGDLIDWETEETDTSNAFNLTTDQFTAPVDGAYYLHADIVGQNNSTHVEHILYVNGVSTNFRGLSDVGSSHTYRQATLSAIIQLDADDEIDIRANGTQYASGGGSSFQTRFSGFLLSGGGGDSGASAVGDLTDISDTTATEGQVLSWNDSAGLWEPSATASAIDALSDIGDVSGTAAGDGQVLAWDNANSEWAPTNAQATSMFSCPAGFTLMQNAGQTLGCMQTDEEGGSVVWEVATDSCFDNYGGRLPTNAEWTIATGNYTLTNETGNWEWLADATGNGGSYSGHSMIGNSSLTSYDWASGTSDAYRCFIPASGQISITTITALSDVSAASPTDGQVLVYDSGEWVASDASAGVSSLVSLTDVSETVATEGQVLAYNDVTDIWEPSDTASAIDALGDIGDVSNTVATAGQFLSWNDTNSSWEPASIADGAFSCPAGFTLMQNAGQTLGCIQTDEDPAGAVTWPTAVDACFNDYGGRLPNTIEWYTAASIYGATLLNEVGNLEWLSDTVGGSTGNDGHANVGSSSITDFGYSYYTSSNYYRCFIPATGQISITTVAALSDVSASSPTDGQVLVYDSGDWVATDASAGVTTLVSLTDVSETAATEGQVLIYTSGEWVASDASSLAGSSTDLSVTFVDSAESEVDTTSQTFSGMSIGEADAGRYIIAIIPGAWVFGGATYNTTSVTIGGVTAIELYEAGYPHRGVSFWIAHVPTGTTADVAVNHSLSTDYRAVALYRVIGLTDSTVISSVFHTTGGTAATLTTAMPKDSVALFGAACGNAALTATWTNATENLEEQKTAGVPESAATAMHVTSYFETSRDVTLTWSGSCPTYNVFAGIVLK